MTIVAERTIEILESSSDLDVLVRRARGSDPAAVDALLSTLRPLILRWAWLRTADRDDAEDVTQSVLLRVHRSLVSFDGRSAFATWLYQVTAHAAVEVHRKRSSWQRLRDRLSGEVVHHVTPAVAEDLTHERTVAIIGQIMTKLTPSQRSALDLVDLQGYEPHEAAQMMNMNRATLRTHLLRARRAVRRELLMEEM